ncbi:MAG: hypothetical protein Q4E82_01615 [Peptococcaceae bacterium]|nr:hypothetical protein [Peptococcaceae bacterium]
MITTKREYSKHGIYKITEEGKNFIKSYSKNGVISFSDYIEALTIMLNTTPNTFVQITEK